MLKAKYICYLRVNVVVVCLYIYSGIRLTAVSWNVMVDSPNVPDLILTLNNRGTLGDEIDLELYTDLPKAQVYNRDDFQPAAAGPGNSKVSCAKDKFDFLKM